MEKLKQVKEWLNNLDREFGDEIKQHPMALIAACFYVCGLALSYTPYSISFIVKDLPLGVFMYLIAAVIDIVIDARGGDTMTQWFRRQFPRWVNYTILIVLCTLTWWLLGPICGMMEIRGVSEGHLGWGKTRK